MKTVQDRSYTANFEPTQKEKLAFRVQVGRVRVHNLSAIKLGFSFLAVLTGEKKKVELGD